MIFNTHYPYIGGSGGGVPQFTYTGQYESIDDGGGNWRIKFLTSGVFKPLKNMTIDAFLVGGGAAGKGETWNAYGGSGGFTTTVKNIVLTKNTEYNIVIGDGGSGNGGAGGASTGFTGTAAGANATPGSGGSGGARMRYGKDTIDAGSDGANGGSANSTGQGSTTREFGESTGDLYAGGGGAAYLSGGTSGIRYAKAGAGGGGGISGLTALPGEPNTGGGGCGRSGSSGTQGAGGSGIVIIRNAR